MKLVKGCKACREQLLKNISPSSEPSLSMLLLELINLSEVDTTSHETHDNIATMTGATLDLKSN